MCIFMGLCEFRCTTFKICSQRPEEGIGFHITGVWGSYEPSLMDIGMETKALCKS